MKAPNRDVDESFCEQSHIHNRDGLLFAKFAPSGSSRILQFALFPEDRYPVSYYSLRARMRYTIESIHRSIPLYEAWNKPEKAEEWRTELADSKD